MAIVMNVIIETLVITMGIVLASWGLFHMLIVGGAVTIFKNIEESEARILIMGWVAQGGFLGFLGLTPPLLVWLFGMHQEIVRTVMALCGVALLMLATHVYITGYSTHIKPIRIGCVLITVYGSFLLTVLFFF